MQRRAAPAVDSLVWISDDRYSRTGSVNLPQHLPLSNVGVLILVQKHDRPSLEEVSSDLRMLGEDPARERNLVPVVDASKRLLALDVCPHAASYLGTALEHVPNLFLRVLTFPAVRGEESTIRLDHTLRFEQMVGACVGKGADVADDGGDPVDLQFLEGQLLEQPFDQ